MGFGSVRFFERSCTLFQFLEHYTISRIIQPVENNLAFFVSISERNIYAIYVEKFTIVEVDYHFI